MSRALVDVWSARLKVWLVGAAMLGLAGVEGARLRALWLGGPAALTAHGERRWLAWAYRRDDLPQILGPVSEQLRDSESVALLVPEGIDGDWWGVMARYYLPRQTIVGVYSLRERARAPAGVRRVVIGGPRGFRILGSGAPAPAP